MTIYVNLKKLKSRIIETAMLMFLLTLYACEEKDEPTQGGTTNQEVLDIPASELSKTLPYEGGTASVSFISSLAWTAEVATEASTWLYVSPTEGDGGDNCTILLTIGENETEEPRTGTVIIRSGKINRTITVSQEAGMLVPGSEGPDDMPIEPW